MQLKSIKIAIFCIFLCLPDGLPRLEIQLKSSKIDVCCIFLCSLDGLPRLEIQQKSIKIDVFCICLCLLDGLPRLEIKLKSVKIVVFCLFLCLFDGKWMKWMKMYWNEWKYKNSITFSCRSSTGCPESQNAARGYAQGLRKQSSKQPSDPGKLMKIAKYVETRWNPRYENISFKGLLKF